MLDVMGLREAPRDYSARIETAKSSAGDRGFDCYLIETNRMKFYAIARRARGLATNAFVYAEWEEYRPIFIDIVRAGIDPLISAVLHQDKLRKPPTPTVGGRPQYPGLGKLANRHTVLNHLRLIAMNEHGPGAEPRADIALRTICSALPYLPWDEYFIEHWGRKKKRPAAA